MVSSHSIPWYDLPARPFPAKVWLEQRFPFRVPLLALAKRRGGAASQAERPADWPASQRRRFPAQVWLEQRQQAQYL